MDTLHKIGKEFQRPAEREREKEDLLKKAEALEQQSRQIAACFQEKHPSGSETKIASVNTISNNVHNAINTIKGWTPLLHSNENTEQIMSILNKAEQDLRPFKEEYDKLAAEEKSKATRP